MCARLQFPSLGWKWESNLPSIHVYCKMIWETKYKEDYEVICNKLFPTFYQVLFDEEEPCLSLKEEDIVKEYGDWYMTPIRFYIRISWSTKPSHWLPHLYLIPCCFRRFLTKPLLMVWLHHSIKTRKDFGLSSIDETSVQDRKLYTSQRRSQCAILL